MRIMKLFVAAAIAVGAMNVATAPAEAQSSRHTGPVPDGRYDDRHDNDRDRRDWRGDRDDRRHWRGDRGRHHGWRNGRGHRYGWYNRRVCRNIWRHGHRQRVCRMVRYRR